MKILFTPALFYPSQLGGPANTLYWLAKALSKANVEVSVVTTDNHIQQGKVKVDKWIDLEGVRVIYCRTGGLCLIKELWHAWKEMRNCDTVMLCDMFQRQVLPVAFMARMRKKRIIWSPRGELFGPAFKNSRLKQWYVCVVRSVFGEYATFHATSEEERELILKHIGKDADTVVIPNYMELPLQMRREEPSFPYFLYVGRINPIKALDKLILGLALSKFFKESKYQLIIGGPNQDGYQQELGQIILGKGLQDKVAFIGSVFGQEKYRLYANAHFSCLLSHSENFGNVVIEALSQGTPIIASTGTPWQVLNEKNAGFWIDNSPESIAACIDKVLEMPESQYVDMRHNARALANSFDVEQNISKWISVISRL